MTVNADPILTVSAPSAISSDSSSSTRISWKLLLNDVSLYDTSSEKTSSYNSLSIGVSTQKHEIDSITDLLGDSRGEM